jgi:hypothetical protein
MELRNERKQENSIDLFLWKNVPATEKKYMRVCEGKCTGAQVLGLDHSKV